MLGEKSFISYKKYVCNFCYFSIAFVGVLAVYFILHNANWMCGDDLEWIRTTAIGKIEPMACHVGQGRFTPLGHYDSNLTVLIPYGYTAFVHYVLVAIYFLLASIFFLKTINKIVPNLNVCLLLAIYSLFVYVSLEIFIFIVYSEKVVLTGLAFFMYTIQKIQEKASWLLTILLCVVVAYITYAKEPVFGAFVVFSLLNFIFRRKEQNCKEKTVCYFCLLNALVFVLLYYSLVYLHSDKFYNQGRVQLNYFQNIVVAIRNQPCLSIIFVLFIYKIFGILKTKVMSYSDIFLFMAVSYCMAYFVLKLNDAYYFIPAIMLALPSICKFLNGLLNLKFAKYPVYLLLCLLLYKSVKNIVVMGKAVSYNRVYYPRYFQDLARIAEANTIYVVTDSLKMSDLHYGYKVKNDEIFIGYWMTPRNLNYKFTYVSSVDSVPKGSYVRIYDNGLKFYKK